MRIVTLESKASKICPISSTRKCALDLCRIIKNNTHKYGRIFLLYLVSVCQVGVGRISGGRLKFKGVGDSPLLDSLNLGVHIVHKETTSVY